MKIDSLISEIRFALQSEKERYFGECKHKNISKQTTTRRRKNVRMHDKNTKQPNQE